MLLFVEDLRFASVKIDEIQDLINAEKAKQYELFKILTTTWGTVIITIVLFLTCLCCACCCCKCCRQFVFWVWDKWTPKKRLRHTRERCFIINNFNGARVQYSEIPQTPPVTLGFSHSLPVSLQGSQQLRSGESPEPRRRSSPRVNES